MGMFNWRNKHNGGIPQDGDCIIAYIESHTPNMAVLCVYDERSDTAINLIFPQQYAFTFWIRPADLSTPIQAS